MSWQGWVVCAEVAPLSVFCAPSSFAVAASRRPQRGVHGRQLGASDGPGIARKHEAAAGGASQADGDGRVRQHGEGACALVKRFETPTYDGLIIGGALLAECASSRCIPSHANGWGYAL
jgi:hypothetical protein